MPATTYDPYKDLIPVTRIAVAPLLLLTNPSSGLASVKDLIDKEMLLGRKATGMTPILKRYEKLFEKMEAMIKKKVSARDPVWKPYFKDMNDCTGEFRRIGLDVVELGQCATHGEGELGA